MNERETERERGKRDWGYEIIEGARNLYAWRMQSFGRWVLWGKIMGMGSPLKKIVLELNFDYHRDF